MAISVDTVYQRVLALANKEQRGYITPQEFNLLANQAELEIFEMYFYDLNIRERVDVERDQHTTLSDITTLIGRKLDPFVTIATVTSGHTFPAAYMIGKIFHNNRLCKQVPRNEIFNLLQSPRHATMLSRSPVYCESDTTGQDIEVYGGATQAAGNTVTCEVITAPTGNVAWGYVVVNEKALYNANSAVNFNLHDSEETNLVNKIAELAGIVINKAGLASTFAGRDANETQIKKQ
tara:strand:- start:438 stop:1142 length:705 start_codon:yes stop_codon:yes gene_type:complete